jgi:hypothetical protein
MPVFSYPRDSESGAPKISSQPSGKLDNLQRHTVVDLSHPSTFDPLSLASADTTIPVWGYECNIKHINWQFKEAPGTKDDL